jgi:hypothetical protein
LRKFLASVAIGALSLAGLVATTMPSASAGAKHVTHGPVKVVHGVDMNKPAPDHIILVGACFRLPVLEGDMARAVSNYKPHENMPPAGLTINGHWIPPNDEDNLARFVCVVVTPPPAPTTTVPVATTLPAPTTTVPVATTLPTPTTEPEHECPPGEHPEQHNFNGREKAADQNNGDHPDHGFNGDHPNQGGPNGDHNGNGFECVPDHPIVTTTTVAPTTTTVAPTTTTVPPTTTTAPPVCPPGEVPAPLNFNGREKAADDHIGNPTPRLICIPAQCPPGTFRFRDRCIPIPTTTVRPTTTTTVAPTTTTVAPTTTTTEPAEGPCTGLGDCHVVCNNVNGTDDCNICIGAGSCDVIVCPVGFELDAQGNCDIVPEQPIAPTTTVPVVTTLPATTTTAPHTTTTVEVTPLSVPQHQKY